MRAKLDLHNYERCIRRLKQRIREEGKVISNAKLIEEYDRCRSIDGTERSTRKRILEELFKFDAWCSKPFEKVERRDLEDYFLKIDNDQKHGGYSRVKVRGCIKTFYRWLLNGGDYRYTGDDPDLIRWIRTHVKYKDKKRLQRDNLFTEEELQKAIDLEQDPQKKAIVSVLSDLGCRPSELVGLDVGDVHMSEHGFVIHLGANGGKTGERTPMLSYSSAVLGQWLNNHPKRNEPSSPLWLHKSRYGKLKRMPYDNVRNIVKAALRRVNPNKPTKPYILRHSRITHSLAQGVFNEAQSEQYFGWIPGSRSVKFYSHLTAADANRALLQKQGVTVENSAETTPQPKICYRCRSRGNAPTDHWCRQCGSPLSLKRQAVYTHMKEEASQLMDKIKDDPEFLALVKRKSMGS